MHNPPPPTVESEAARMAAYRIDDEQRRTRDAFLDRACSLGSAPGCRRAGGARLGIDQAAAMASLERACALDPGYRPPYRGDGDCVAAMRRFAAEAQEARASCSAKRPRDCRRLELLLAPFDLVRALEVAYEEAEIRGPEAHRAGAAGYASERLLRLVVGIAPAGPNGAQEVFRATLREEIRAALEPAVAPSPAPDERAGPGVVRVVEVTGDTGDAEAARAVVESNLHRIRGCYAEALEENPRIQGAIGVRVVVDRVGDVASAGNGGSDVPSTALVDCAVRALARLQFPARPRAGAHLVRFELSPGASPRASPPQ